jgi:transcriptional regulator with XRE-family HTH domain
VSVWGPLPKSMFTPEYRLLLDIVVAERDKSGLTQQEVADRLGKPQPWVSYIENGVRRLDILEFIAVMRALGADPEAVFGDFLGRLPARVHI